MVQSHTSTVVQSHITLGLPLLPNYLMVANTDAVLNAVTSRQAITISNLLSKAYTPFKLPPFQFDLTKSAATHNSSIVQ